MRARLYFLVILIAIGAMGCRDGFVYKVFNNTGQEVVVYSYDKKGDVKQYHIAHGGESDVAYPSRMVIRCGVLEWQYEKLRYDKTYEYQRINGFKVQDVQINNDGRIFLMAPKSNGITDKFPEQPQGYPLIPK